MAANHRKRVPRSRRVRRAGGAGHQTDLGCPDCSGTLRERKENREGLLSFTCRVGHAFSGESLIRSKEDQLEHSLWSAVETFGELVALHDEMAADARAKDAAGLSRAYRRRSKRAQALRDELRGIISRDGPALVSGARARR